jgi:Ribbon-helix-helix protein, copG family
MDFHMKTTLEIEGSVMRRLKERAAREGTTLSEIVEGALRAYLKELDQPKELPPLPTWNSGGFLVDIDDRNALYDAMDEDDDVRR